MYGQNTTVYSIVYSIYNQKICIKCMVRTQLYIVQYIVYIYNQKICIKCMVRTQLYIV